MGYWFLYQGVFHTFPPGFIGERFIPVKRFKAFYPCKVAERFLSVTLLRPQSTPPPC